MAGAKQAKRPGHLARLSFAERHAALERLDERL
jgi:hypothetical protein